MHQVAYQSSSRKYLFSSSSLDRAYVFSSRSAASAIRPSGQFAYSPGGMLLRSPLNPSRLSLNASTAIVRVKSPLIISLTLAGGREECRKRVFAASDISRKASRLGKPRSQFS